MQVHSRVEEPLGLVSCEFPEALQGQLHLVGLHGSQVRAAEDDLFKVTLLEGTQVALVLQPEGSGRVRLRSGASFRSARGT